MIIKIATDFSDTPGARHYKDGPNSGQAFYETVLFKSFKKSNESNESLIIDFDDCYGFASSFLSESFGKLSLDFGANLVLKKLQFISKQDAVLIDRVVDVINNPYKTSRPQ